jgi:CelD/BcsL family acetyltransferase involved in cellulose biosynthesis
MPRESIDDPRWLELVARDPAATAFHHPAWSYALSAAYGFRPLLIAVEEDGALVAGLPLLEIRSLRGRRWVALPFTDRCAPLGSPRYAARLVNELEAARASAGVSSLEVREPIRLDGAGRPTFVRHVVPLEPDVDAVERRYAPSVRRANRQAETSGARLRIGTTEQDVAELFYGLHIDTRRRLGLPVQPRRFFRHLWRCLGPELCRTVLLEVRGQPIAGVILLTWNKNLVFKYGASDRRHWRLRPNNLLFAETIRWACANGYTEFDLGRTDVGAETLRRFKRGWGAREESLEYRRIGRGRTVVDAGSSTVLRATLRHSPRWVVRLTGEVMYRHAA